VILAKLELGLSAKRVYQDLAAEHGFTAKYHSVRRFVARLEKVSPLPFRRIEVPPGEEAQIDFGTGAPVVDDRGRRRKTHVLRVVLSHSRKAYSEVVFRQTTQALIQCLENAFHHFGGVPKTIVPDNLKAAVIKADWYDPDLNPRLSSFCEHYGTVLMPTKPRMPRHKGKVERGVDYVQENALKGRKFSSLEEQNEFLLSWEANVADTRIHGTTQKHVGKAFDESEAKALSPLPRDRFPFFEEGQRKVAMDGHVSVAKSFYSVPPEYVREQVWTRWDSRTVRIFDMNMKQLCVHPRQAPGKFSTLSEHIASEKINAVERGADWLLDRVEYIGKNAFMWAQGCLSARGVQGMRTLQGLLSMTKKHDSRAIDQACKTAHANQCYRLKTIRHYIDRDVGQQQEFEFLEEHPLIRNLDEYGEVVRTNFQKEALHE
jgi:transposase